MPTATAQIIDFTDAALSQLLNTAESESVDLTEVFLRISVVPGGCSGLTYDLGWETSPSGEDQHLEKGALQIVVDPRSAAYLSGSTLDFTDGLEGKGFHFNNPQAVRNCACGESFGL